MLNRLRRRTRSQEGFTNTAAATALLRDGSVAMESSYTDAQSYPASPAAAVTALAAINPSIAWKATSATTPNPPKNEVVVTASTATTYTLQATSGSKTYTYARAADGAVTRSCGGGCTW